MLLTAHGEPPRDPGKVAEVKWDGCRARLVKSREVV
jgi:ATP-dependent DNA ligase